jgi:hypothetical protein
MVGIGNINILKNRNGATGTTKFRYNNHMTASPTIKHHERKQQRRDNEAEEALYIEDVIGTYVDWSTNWEVCV